MRLFSLAGEDQDSPGLGPRSLNDEDEAEAAEFSQGRRGGTGSVGESSALDPVSVAPDYSPVWLRRPKGKKFMLRRRRGKEREAPSRREQTRGKRQREESRRARGKPRFSSQSSLHRSARKHRRTPFSRHPFGGAPSVGCLMLAARAARRCCTEINLFLHIRGKACIEKQRRPESDDWKGERGASPLTSEAATTENLRVSKSSTASC